MRSSGNSVVILALGILATVAVSGLALAQDENPVVVVPEDIPGADVIVLYGDAYTFDASASYDNDGISYFTFEFSDGGTPIALWSDDGVEDYTFNMWGQTWVTVTAYDWWGNKGAGYFSIDVVEVVDYDQDWIGEYRYIDHSLYLQGADLNIDGSTVVFADGAGGSPAGGGGGGAPEMLADSATPGGDLAGRWAPSYSSYYGNEYGTIYEDYDTKMSGDLSIKCTDSSWGYMQGFEYWFDSPADLTQYNMLTFWWRNSYPYSSDISLYFYTDDYYSWPYAYTYDYICYYATQGWYGVSISLDFDRVGYSWNYIGSFSSIRCIQFQQYGDDYYYGPMWIDNVGFSKVEAWGDSITEDPYPGGDMAGEWSGGAWGPEQSSDRWAGDYSVQFYLYAYDYNTITYKWYNPVDLSMYDALRMFNWFDGYYYLYWWGSFYVYSANGGYAQYNNANFMNYYASYAYGKWYLLSLPWGPDSYYNGWDMDWSQVIGISFDYLYTYNDGYLRVDAMEWLAPGAGGGGGGGDTVPLAIYVDGGDTTIKGNSYVQGEGKTGARIWTSGGTGTFAGATFDNMWSTSYAGVHNSHGVYGGLEVVGGDTVMNDVSFMNCKGPAFSVFDGNMRLDPGTIRLDGAAMKTKLSPKFIVGATEAATGQVSIDLTGWDIKDSPVASGFMVMLDECTQSVDVQVHENTLERDAGDGIIISNWGGSAALSVSIYDQAVKEMGSSGIYYWAAHGEWAPSVVARLSLENVSSTFSKADGLAVRLAAGATNLELSVNGSSFLRNGAAGIATYAEGYFGVLDALLTNTTSSLNEADGLYIYSSMMPWVDGDGNTISPVSELALTIRGSSITANEGNGIREDLSALDRSPDGAAPPWPWSGPVRTTLVLDIAVELTSLSSNSGGGWHAISSDGWFGAGLEADRRALSSTIDENRGIGVYIEPYTDLLGTDASIVDGWGFENTTINDNPIGLYVNLGVYNPGYYFDIQLDRCRVDDSDAEAVLIDGARTSDGIREWGVSGVLGGMVRIDGTHINGPVRLGMMGASDWGMRGWSARMGIGFTNNVVDVEEDIDYSIGAMPDCAEFTAWCDIGGNRFFRPALADGIELDVYGGRDMALDLTLRDQKFTKVPGSGIDISLGLLYNSLDLHQMTGSLTVRDVVIERAAWNGINLTVDNVQVVGARNRAVLVADGLVVDGAFKGLLVSEMDGDVSSSYLRNCTAGAVHIAYSLFDFYGCDIGPITTENVRVMTKGAARIWYDVGVDVRWGGGARVAGAVVSLQDNTLATLGVSAMGALEPVAFGYVNSYTVLPDDVFSKCPFLVQATYLGLTTQRQLDIIANTIIELTLVDDVLPRLTVTTPSDGQEQTSRELSIKGFAWDLHSGMAMVEVSIDGDEWFTAEGTSQFSYAYSSVPEGSLVLSVRALDAAGNVVVEQRSLLVDATAPLIHIIEPTVDVLTTNVPALRVTGVTEVGATVTVANRPVTMELSMFTITVNLREGPNEVRVVASDHLGNTATHVISVLLDTIPPPLIVTAPMANAMLSSSRVTVVGQTEEGALVRINGAPVANIQGAFTGTTNLLEGTNVLSVEAQDAIGNTATVRIPIVVDTTPPWLSLVEPVQGRVYGASGILIDGWVEPGTRVFVNDQELPVVNGRFLGTIMGTEGAYTVSVVAVDVAGNDAPTAVTVIVDTIAPRIVLTAPEDGALTSADHIIVEGRLVWDRETFRDVTLTLNGGFLPFSADGSFRERVPVVEGSNPMSFVVMDDVGNEGTAFITVHRDSTSPFLLVEATPTFMHPVWNKPATYNGMVYVDGFAEPGSMVTVGGAEISVGADGHFNVSFTLAALDVSTELSRTTISVVATDAAGNSNVRELEVYRLKEEAEKKGFERYESAQWWALLLSIVVLVLALLVVWVYVRWSERRRVEEAMQAGPQ